LTPDLGPDAGFVGKVAIVTGGGALGEGIGNGRAACILLARAGARVLVVDRELDLARQTVEMIAEEGGEAAAFAADVSDEGECRAMVEAALTRFGRLDLLDNNVGIASKGSVVAEDPQRWRRVTPASSRDRLWWSMAAPHWSGPRARPSRSSGSRQAPAR
jgi:NAD(P)-dependent dehydrogenase (short-subunit alcohol dehydrogenase family)